MVKKKQQPKFYSKWEKGKYRYYTIDESGKENPMEIDDSFEITLFIGASDKKDIEFIMSHFSRITNEFIHLDTLDKIKIFLITLENTQYKVQYNDDLHRIEVYKKDEVSKS